MSRGGKEEGANRCAAKADRLLDKPVGGRQALPRSAIRGAVRERADAACPRAGGACRESALASPLSSALLRRCEAFHKLLYTHVTVWQ